MKILFQGGWKVKRDPQETEKDIRTYCEFLADYVVTHGHQVVLSSTRDYDRVIAERVVRNAKEQNKNVKDHLLFLLPDRIKQIPEHGRVIKFETTRWWIEERTYLVQQSDVLVAIGGGRGTFDCVEKAFLSEKPVFVVSAIASRAAEAWKRRKPHYKYIRQGDADFQDDLNTSPSEYFDKVFKIIDSLAKTRFTRKIFIVHGHDYHFRDAFVNLLNTLDFQPVVLQNEPSKSLTIIEKLERDTDKVGFCFALYTPDDLGHLPDEPEKPRARQNVIFEHGLLIGLLGRERTCAIVKGNLEIPSDILGMIYETISDVKKDVLKIARILKQAGYEVDATRLLE